MFAIIEKQSNHHVAKFKRPLPHPVDTVWAAVTKNENLQKWMGNLEIIELGKNRKIHFNMNDGTDAYEEIAITDYAEQEILEFDWAADTVRFELSSTENGSLLLLVETMRELTAHTPKDLAGWHVCLDLLADLLNGIEHTDFPMENWQQCFNEYQKRIDTVEKFS
ncbi:SRPBCC family protein [Lysinibacillus sp. FSL H8-0500]|uniref:SRPBCC family protein n=1 Tax=Lysinibacillus sp. FSL H8-0500 TaxID=2921393 RepID=UPI003100FC36